MKNIAVLMTILFAVICGSVNAQNRPTGARPSQDRSLGMAISTLGRYTEESVEIKSDGKGSFKDWRLTGPGINVFAGATKDGLDANIGLNYQLRIPKAPKLRCLIFGLNGGTRQLTIDGEKNWSMYAQGTLMIDVMTLIAPKSRVILNLGGGASYNHVAYSGQIELGDQLITRDYSGSAFGPVVKAQIGYDFDRRFSVMAEVSYLKFDVSRKPFENYHFSSMRAGITLQYKIGRGR